MPLEQSCEVQLLPPPNRLVVLPGDSIHLQCNSSIPVPPPVREGEPLKMVSQRVPLYLYLSPHGMKGASGRVGYLVLSLSLLSLSLPTHTRLFRESESMDLSSPSSLYVTIVPCTLSWDRDGYLHQIRCSISRQSQLPFHQAIPSPPTGISWLKFSLLPRRVPGAVRVLSPTHFQLFTLLT